MARQPGGYVPTDADEYTEKYHRIVTPITRRNREREQLLSKLPVTNKEYGNFNWDKDIPSYEPTAVKSKKAWRDREIASEVEKAERGFKSPEMSDPNNIGFSQYRREIERYRKSMNGDSPRGENGFSKYSYQNGHSNGVSNGRSSPRRAPSPQKNGVIRRDNPRKSEITRDNLKMSDISRLDLVVHLNDRSTLVIRDVAFDSLR